MRRRLSESDTYQPGQCIDQPWALLAGHWRVDWNASSDQQPEDSYRAQLPAQFSVGQWHFCSVALMDQHGIFHSHRRIPSAYVSNAPRLLRLCYSVWGVVMWRWEGKGPKDSTLAATSAHTVELSMRAVFVGRKGQGKYSLTFLHSLTFFQWDDIVLWHVSIVLWYKTWDLLWYKTMGTGLTFLI